MTDLKFWQGESLRQLRAARPCSCGCDERDGEHAGWAGYLTASDADGRGFTLWVKDESAFEALERLAAPQ